MRRARPRLQGVSGVDVNWLELYTLAPVRVASTKTLMSTKLKFGGHTLFRGQRIEAPGMTGTQYPSINKMLGAGDRASAGDHPVAELLRRAGRIGI